MAELSARDAEVRAHEAAHASAGGGLAGSPSYSYQTGPDGKQYAVGGEVSIDTSGGATPQETIARMRQVRAAALAPANPSGQDQAVAASASRREAAAREEMAKVAAEASGPPAAHEHDGSVCPFCNTAAQRYKAVAEAKATAPSSQHAVRAEPV
ncbi:MAG: hypothetical protein KTR31_24500 [Myxococcales bacterium]|nr:hypothetical protein [Myxococcales bacterium]